MVMPTIDFFAFAVMCYKLLVGLFPFGSIRTDSDMAVYYAHANNDEWNRDALQITNNALFWKSILEPCLKGNYQKRLGDVKYLITQFESKFPEVCSNSNGIKEEHSKYSQMTDYGLRVLYGNQHGVPLCGLHDKGITILTLGRHSDGVTNDIEIRDDENRYVSRRHATLEWDGTERHWYIRDGQYDVQNHSCRRSKNGTYVNSREIDDIKGVRLEVDDIIYVGDIRIGVVGFDAKGWMYYGGERHKHPMWT